MLSLFLQLLDFVALEGEQGLRVDELWKQHKISDPATQQYLFQLLQRDRRVTVSKDSSHVAAADYERRRALGITSLEPDVRDVHYDILARVGKAREQGMVFSTLAKTLDKSSHYQVDRLVVLGLLAKRIVTTSGRKVARHNVLLLPRFIKSFDPTSRGWSIEMDDAERAQLYDR